MLRCLSRYLTPRPSPKSTHPLVGKVTDPTLVLPPLSQRMISPPPKSRSRHTSSTTYRCNCERDVFQFLSFSSHFLLAQFANKTSFSGGSFSDISTVQVSQLADKLQEPESTENSESETKNQFQDRICSIALLQLACAVDPLSMTEPLDSPAPYPTESVSAKPTQHSRFQRPVIFPLS